MPPQEGQPGVTNGAVGDTDTCTWLSLPVQSWGDAVPATPSMEHRASHLLPTAWHRPAPSPSKPWDFLRSWRSSPNKQGLLLWQSTWSISRCSTAHGAETRGHAGISALCPCPQQKQHEGQKRCHGVPESRHTARELWGCRCGAGAGKAWSRVRERTRSSRVLTSRRSLVLHAGDKERKSHHS